jgi:hypothetical protein
MHYYGNGKISLPLALSTMLRIVLDDSIDSKTKDELLEGYNQQMRERKEKEKEDFKKWQAKRNR